MEFLAPRDRFTSWSQGAESDCPDPFPVVLFLWNRSNKLHFSSHIYLYKIQMIIHTMRVVSLENDTIHFCTLH